MTGTGTATNPGTGDRTTVRWLIESLTDLVGPAALRCQGGDVRHVDGSELVRVSAFDVRTAALCQARAAAPGEPFLPALHTATRAVALRAGRRARRFPTVLDAVADTVKQLRQRTTGNSPFDPDEWLILYLQSLPLDVRARLVARATTWLTATLDLLGVGHEGDPRAFRGWQWEPRASWSYPGRGLRLETKVDLALPEPGNFVPVVVAAGTQDPVLDQVAYSVVLWTINRRRVPSRVLLVTQSEQSARVLHADDLFDRGLGAAVRAADAVTRRPPPAAPDTSDGTGAGSPDPGSPFPQNLTVSGSFLLCVDCGWRTRCPSPHPDAAVNPSGDGEAVHPGDGTAGITVRGGIRLPDRYRP